MTKRTWIPEAGAVLLGTFALMLLMGCGAFLGFSRAETAMALAIMVGAVMMHRLTEAIREL
jgi:hypothetical protein